MTTTTDISTAAAALGRKGGQAKTEAKAAAVRANGAKGGRPAFEWLVITTGRSLNTYTVWAKKKTEAAAIKLVRDMGRNGAEGHTLVINIADRAKYGA
jgi:hypothetical protein